MAMRAIRGAAVAVGGVLFAAQAMAGTVGGNDTAARSAFQNQLTGLLGSLSAATAEAQGMQGTGMAVWVDSKTGSGSLLGAAASPGDTAWAKTALLVSDLAKSFGAGGNSRILMQRDKDQFYSGIEGVGGNWFASAAAAQAFLFQLLLADNVAAPPQAKTPAQTATVDDVANAVAAAAQAVQETRKLATAGTSTTLTLSSAKFDPLALPAIYARPDIRIAKVERLTAADVAVTFDIAGSVKPGALQVRAYKPNSSFVALDTFELFISGGGSGLAAPADDHGGTAATATMLSGSNDGEIAANGDEDVFQASLTAKGMLTLSTSGPTDVVLQLEDASGTVIVKDDDGGGWYNAKLARQLNAGTYFVRLRHAAGGTGRYTLKSDFLPN